MTIDNALMPVRRTIAGVGPDTDPQEIAAALGLLEALADAVKSMRAELKAGMLEWVDAHGDLTIGEKRYYAGTETDVTCNDQRETLATLLEVTDLDTIASCLAAGAWKHGVLQGVAARGLRQPVHPDRQKRPCRWQAAAGCSPSIPGLSPPDSNLPGAPSIGALSSTPFEDLNMNATTTSSRFSLDIEPAKSASKNRKARKGKARPATHADNPAPLGHQRGCAHPGPVRPAQRVCQQPAQPFPDRRMGHGARGPRHRAHRRQGGWHLVPPPAKATGLRHGCRRVRLAPAVGVALFYEHQPSHRQPDLPGDADGRGDRRRPDRL